MATRTRASRGLPKRKAGRPKKIDGPKFGARAQRTYLAALARGLHRYVAADKAGVHMDTVRAYRKEHPEFTEREAEAIERSVGNMEGAIYKAGMAGDFRAAAFFLCNKAPDRWRKNRPDDAPAALPAASQSPWSDEEYRVTVQRERLEIFRKRYAAVTGHDPGDLAGIPGPAPAPAPDAAGRNLPDGVRQPADPARPDGPADGLSPSGLP